MTNSRQLVLSGSIAVDRIMSFSGYFKELIHPDQLQSLSLSVLIDKLENSDGGTAANIAYNLTLLREHPILVGSIGKDSSSYLQKMKSSGIDVSYVYQSDLPTATFTVLTDRDNNQVGGFYPGAMKDSVKTSLLPWKETSAIIVISANDPDTMRLHVKSCNANNLHMIYDVGQQVANITPEDLRQGLHSCRILFLSDYELGVVVARTGISEKKIKQTVPVIITTHGSKGSSIEGKLIFKPIHIPAVADCMVIDPTGAGDAYRAGFLYGYQRDWDLLTCGQLGTILASFAIETSGTQNHHITTGQITSRFKKTFRKNIHLT